LTVANAAPAARAISRRRKRKLQSQYKALQTEGRWMGGTGKYNSLQGSFVLAGIAR
jgi:hypothetical protein